MKKTVKLIIPWLYILFPQSSINKISKNTNNKKICKTDNNFKTIKTILILSTNPDTTHLIKHWNIFWILYCSIQSFKDNFSQLNKLFLYIIKLII